MLNNVKKIVVCIQIWLSGQSIQNIICNRKCNYGTLVIDAVKTVIKTTPFNRRFSPKIRDAAYL